MTTSQLLLRDILALPALVRAHAELLAGAERLDTPVRWVHVMDTARAAAHVDGGELLITTGRIFGTDPAQQRALIDGLHAGGAAALLVEVGVHIDILPEEILRQCRAKNLPLIVVYEEVRFNSITEAVHHAIMERHVKQLTSLQKITESFWGLIYNGAPPEQLVRHASRELGKPVVLEDLNHRVILYCEGHERPSELLRNWEAKSRIWAKEAKGIGLIADPITVRDPDDDTTWILIDVQAQGHHWGKLCARNDSIGNTDNTDAAIDATDSHVLRHAAMALAIERLGNPNPHSWTDLRERIGLERLLDNRYITAEGQRVVLESSGFNTRGRSLVAAELRFTHSSRHQEPPTPLQPGTTFEPAAVRAILARLSPTLEFIVAPHPHHRDRILCVLSDVSTRIQPRLLAQSAFDLLADACCTTSNEAHRVNLEMAASIGLEGPVDAASALHVIGETPLADTSGGSVLTWVAREQIELVIGGLHHDVRAQAFAENIVAPLLIHDSRHGTDLVGTVKVLLDNPTSRSAAAEQLHLSRAALYSRIATIERLCDTDLTNGDQLFRLALALRTYFGT